MRHRPKSSSYNTSRRKQNFCDLRLGKDFLGHTKKNTNLKRRRKKYQGTLKF